MAIEGFDATLLIDNAGFRPQVEIPEADSGSTLDMALRQSALGESGNSSGSDAVLDRAAMRAEMATLDLWINDEAGNVFRSLEIGGAGAAAGRIAGNTNLIDTDPSAAGDDASTLGSLSAFEKELIASGFQEPSDPGASIQNPNDPFYRPWLLDEDQEGGGENGGNGSGDSGEAEIVVYGYTCVGGGSYGAVSSICYSFDGDFYVAFGIGTPGFTFYGGVSADHDLSGWSLYASPGGMSWDVLSQSATFGTPGVDLTYSWNLSEAIDALIAGGNSLAADAAEAMYPVPPGD